MNASINWKNGFVYEGVISPCLNLENVSLFVLFKHLVPIERASPFFTHITTLNTICLEIYMLHFHILYHGNDFSVIYFEAFVRRFQQYLRIGINVFSPPPLFFWFQKTISFEKNLKFQEFSIFSNIYLFRVKETIFI